MRNELEIAKFLLRLNPVQLYMVDKFFSDDELIIVRDVIGKAAAKDGPYRIEDGWFVLTGDPPLPPANTIPTHVPNDVLLDPRIDDATVQRARNLEI